jgi:hypothetical protein
MLCLISGGCFTAVVLAGADTLRRSFVFSRWMLCHHGFIRYVDSLVILYFVCSPLS